jgi:hypothetical protein
MPDNPSIDPNPPSAFINPYSGCEKAGESIRFQSRILADDYTYIASLRVQNGTITTVCNILFKKLVDECRHQGFTDLTDKEAFERFVVECRLAIPVQLSTDLVKNAKSKRRKSP